MSLSPAVARSSTTTIRALTSQTAHTTTGASGEYRFSRLAPGNYRVTASIESAGIEYTFDTDGRRDWSVAVSLTAGGTATAQFAGLGKGTIDGKVYTSTTDAPISNAAVQCRWAGFDDVLRTSDDVMLDATADAGGQFHLAAVPYGQFSCVGRDPVTGTDSAVADVWVLSVVPVHPQLPVTPTRQTPPVAPQQPPVELANTGGILHPPEGY